MSLAENIKRAREERGVSQEYVAGRLQVSRQAVSKWETGQSEPSTQNLLQLARLLEVDVNVLLHRGGAGRRAVRQAPEQRGLVTVLSRRNAMLLSASCAAQMAIFCVNQGQITRSKDIMALFSGLFMVLLLGNVWLTVEKAARNRLYGRIFFFVLGFQLVLILSSRFLGGLIGLAASTAFLVLLIKVQRPPQEGGEAEK